MQRSTNIAQLLILESLAAHLMTATFACAAAEPVILQRQPLVRLLELIQQLAVYLNRTKPNEQLEAATVLGIRGTREQRPGLIRLLQSREPDARIGAANGRLHLLR